MRKRLIDKVAWISGAASGMGEAIAELFAREGACVAVADVQGSRGRAVAERIERNGGRTIFDECDVSQEEQVQDSIQKTVDRFGGLQIVINSAGVFHFKTLDHYSEQEWDELMDINVKSIFFSLKHSIDHMSKNSRSYLVNIGSIGSFIGQASTPAYITSKHAVLGLSRSIALDYARLGLRCNCICPGITDTPMLRFALEYAPDPETALAKGLRRVPMGTSILPGDIAKTALFLCCEDSSGVTGTSIVVDGGYITASEWESGNTKFQKSNIENEK